MIITTEGELEFRVEDGLFRRAIVPIVGPWSKGGKSHVVRSQEHWGERMEYGKPVQRYRNNVFCGFFNDIGAPSVVQWVPVSAVTCKLCRAAIYRIAKSLQDQYGIDDVEVLSDRLIDIGFTNPLLPLAAAECKPIDYERI